jgi:hypothetical protein
MGTLFAPTAGLVGCAEDPLGDLRPPGPAQEVGGRQRFIVTLTDAAPDLAEYRTLLKANPTAVPAYVEQRRAALARPEIEAALAGLQARIVERWWMSGQLTVEVAPDQLPAIKSLPGIAAVDADVALP